MKTELHRAVAIWRLLANDTQLCEYVTPQDTEAFKRRACAEGMKFLTVTLPSLGKALDKSFETGQFVLPDGWRPAKNCAYPMFLHKAWSALFTEDGTGRWVERGDNPAESQPGFLRPVLEPLGSAVLVIRQLTLVFYKYETPWTEEQEKEVLESFVTTEDDLRAVNERLNDADYLSLCPPGNHLSLESLLGRAKTIIGRLLHRVDPCDIKPQYGTGATAEKASPQGRWQSARFIPKLDEVYPYTDWFCSGINGLIDLVNEGELAVTECEYPDARVILVPKDSRGPRLISAEPSEFMFIQKGLMTAMYDAMESYPNVRRQVSCTDQTRNQRLCHMGSHTGGLATLDLKEASDRVSWNLVQKLFPPAWVRSFNACRSEHTVMPNGVRLPLQKFAPMGSACCFPVEAIIFWALGNAVKTDYSEARLNDLFCRRQRKQTVSQNSIWGLDDICVFGDDIIVPSTDVDRTIGLLEAVGLLVNRQKSFLRGPFRESCGTDYFAGVNVTPLRVNNTLAGDHVTTLLRFNDVCNNILLKFGQTEPDLVHKLRELSYEFFGLRPAVFPGREGVGASGHYLLDSAFGQRLSGQTLFFRKKEKRWTVGNVRVRRSNAHSAQPNYQRIEARTLTELPIKEKHDLGWRSVLRAFCVNAEGRGGADVYAIRRRVRHKTTWVSV